VSRPPPIGFVISFQEGDNLANAQAKEGFNVNAYRLVEKL